MDVVASLFGRNSLLPIIEKASREIFIPLTVGGGIRTLDDIKNALRAGADKVALNSAVVQDPYLIKRASEKFGSSTIVVSVEAIRQNDGRYLAFCNGGREHTGLEVSAWVERVCDLGAGEILLTSVDKEGTGEGYDQELCRKVSELSSVPVIVSGGAGSKEDISDVIKNCKPDAVSFASVLHYDFIKHHDVLADYQANDEGNLTFLRSGRRDYSKVQSENLINVKNHIIQELGPVCRPAFSSTGDKAHG
jgi:cyclase